MTQTVVRGSQVGFNICNSTTQNQQSECQTAFVNNIFGALRLTPLDLKTYRIAQTFVFTLHLIRIRRSPTRRDMKSLGAPRRSMVLD
jgi:hypothetical protein